MTLTDVRPAPPAERRRHKAKAPLRVKHVEHLLKEHRVFLHGRPLQLVDMEEVEREFVEVVLVLGGDEVVLRQRDVGNFEEELPAVPQHAVYLGERKQVVVDVL